MKLIYVWLENYNDRIVNQEFLFSPEFMIHYDNDWNELYISRNGAYIREFYGDKKELVIRIRGISGLDIEILDDFFEIVDGRSLF